MNHVYISEMFTEVKLQQTQTTFWCAVSVCHSPTSYLPEYWDPASLTGGDPTGSVRGNPSHPPKAQEHAFRGKGEGEVEGKNPSLSGVQPSLLQHSHLEVSLCPGGMDI